MLTHEVYCGNGRLIFRRHARFHRIGGAAVIDQLTVQSTYYEYGELHRIGGPSYVWGDLSSFYKRGVKYFPQV